MQKMLAEFREFALRGNVVDLAIGVIIGAAFNGIINSFVTDVISPVLSIFTKKINFSDLFIAVSTNHYETAAEAKAAGVATINYGLFLNNVINFLIVAWVVFLFVKQINRLRKKAPAPESNTRLCPYCQMMIPKAASRCPNCTSQLVSV